MNMDITKLADMWRNDEAGFRVVTHDKNLSCHNGLTCANELESALPKWTRITDDPATWPELDGEPTVEIIYRSPDRFGRPGKLEGFEWDQGDTVALMEGDKLKFKGGWYRYTTDLDYPPETE